MGSAGSVRARLRSDPTDGVTTGMAEERKHTTDAIASCQNTHSSHESDPNMTMSSPLRSVLRKHRLCGREVWGAGAGGGIARQSHMRAVTAQHGHHAAAAGGTASACVVRPLRTRRQRPAAAAAAAAERRQVAPGAVRRVPSLPAWRLREPQPALAKQSDLCP